MSDGDFKSAVSGASRVALDRLLSAIEHPECAMTESQIAACVAAIGLGLGPAVLEVRPGDTLMIPVEEGTLDQARQQMIELVLSLLPNGAKAFSVDTRAKVPFCVLRPQPAQPATVMAIGSSGGGGSGVGGGGVVVSGGGGGGVGGNGGGGTYAVRSRPNEEG